MQNRVGDFHTPFITTLFCESMKDYTNGRLKFVNSEEKMGVWLKKRVRKSITIAETKYYKTTLSHGTSVRIVSNSSSARPWLYSLLDLGSARVSQAPRRISLRPIKTSSLYPYCGGFETLASYALLIPSPRKCVSAPRTR